MAEFVRNVFGQPIVPCSFEPLTGFFRDGCCKTNEEDVGLHLVCAVMTEEFLEFSFQRGNDLITPQPEWNFPGLKAGDQWCLCVTRWQEALANGCAPLLKLESTHINALDHVDFDTLQLFAVDNPSEV